MKYGTGFDSFWKAGHTWYRFARIGLYILFFCCLPFLPSCSHNKQVNPGKRHIQVTKDVDIVIESDSERKVFYTNLNGKKHGMYMEYDANNSIQAKRVYFKDTLLQEKEYQWNKNTLDSITFSTYDYEEVEQKKVFKNISLRYPKDHLFFTVEFPLVENVDYSSYTFHLKGKGGVAASINYVREMTMDEIDDDWDKMKMGTKYIHSIYEDIPNRNTFFSQPYVLLIDENGDTYTYKQLLIYYVPIITNDSLLVNKLSKYKITF